MDASRTKKAEPDDDLVHQLRSGSVMLPRHVAIIMDGNGRWARARGLPRSAGHRRGAETLRAVVRRAGAIGIEFLTVFAFSSENWSRPATEVQDLMRLLHRFIRKDLQELHKNDVKLRMIGSRNGVNRDTIALIEEAERLTCNNTSITVIVAFNYGSRDEILRAAKTLAARVESGALRAEDVQYDDITAALDTHDIPDPDLVIRTSGEQRLSNFLLWQSAYSELLFVDTKWPDFGTEHFDRAIKDFGLRQRRFGGRSPDIVDEHA